MARASLSLGRCALLGFLVTQLFCASAKKTVYSPKPLAEIDSWRLGFTYEAGYIAATAASTGESQVTVANTGRNARDLQLRDDIFFLLRDKYGFVLSSGSEPSDGLIALNSVDFRNGGFKSLDVRFQAADGTVLARIRIKNSNRNCCFKDDDDFAKYAASRIANLLRSLSASQ